MRRLERWSVAALLLTLPAGPAPAGSGLDGRLFDPGIGRTERAAGAPEELDRARFLLGDWEVAVETRPEEGEPVASGGRSAITFMNRGHALMERFTGDGPQEPGSPLHAMGFLVFNPAGGVWGWGEGDSRSETLRVADGGFQGDALVVRDARRRSGGLTLTHTRLTWTPHAEGFRRAEEVSTDHGATWRTAEVRTYRRAGAGAPAIDPAPTADRGPEAATDPAIYGRPAADLPPEALEFAFLIGRWSSSHEMVLPSDQVLRWTTRSTAVWALGGHAVLEFNWFDTDPRLPDAATSILRLYNRNERRWECLYMTNRFNGLLHFGGRRDGERIVLHSLAVGAADPVARYVFHGIGPDRYDWFAETSRDRGATFRRTWTIRAERVSDPSAGKAVSDG